MTENTEKTKCDFGLDSCLNCGYEGQEGIDRGHVKNNDKGEALCPKCGQIIEYYDYREEPEDNLKTVVSPESVKAASDAKPQETAFPFNPFVDSEMAQKICDFLNSLLKYDRPAIAAMIANRIPCSKELADHPTVQVVGQHGGFHVGLLGLINGMCGIHPDGNGPIRAVFDGEDDLAFKDLVSFTLTEPPSK